MPVMLYFTGVFPSIICMETWSYMGLLTLNSFSNLYRSSDVITSTLIPAQQIFSGDLGRGVFMSYVCCRYRIEKDYTALKSKENEDQIELRVRTKISSLHGGKVRIDRCSVTIISLFT